MVWSMVPKATGVVGGVTPPRVASVAPPGELGDLPWSISGHRSCAYSWTSSMSVPNEVFGCTKATVVPREPGRGASLIPPPAGFDRVERRCAVGDPIADMVDPFAFGGQELRDRQVIPGRREELDIGIGDGRVIRLLHSVAR